MSERCGRNLARYWANPSKRWTPGTSVGLGMSTIAFTLVGSIPSPSDVATWPMNRTSSCLSLNLSTFSLTPRSSHRCRNEWSRLSWSTFASSTVLPYPTTTKSSATTSIPCSPSISSCIFFWKTSGPNWCQTACVCTDTCQKVCWRSSDMTSVRRGARAKTHGGRQGRWTPWLRAAASRYLQSSVAGSFLAGSRDLDPSDRDRCEVCCLSSWSRPSSWSTR